MSSTVLSRLLAVTAAGLVPALVLAQPPAEKAPVTATAKADTKTESAAADPVEVDKKILAEVKDRSQVMKNLQHLCDVIGPRVTGTPALEKANKWAEQKMTEYGLTNVKLEPWEIPVAWERGTCTMTLIEPTKKTLTVAAAAWTGSTKGKITGEVVVIDAKTKDDLAKYKGKLKDAVVITRPPADPKLSNVASYLQPGRPGAQPGQPQGGRPNPPATNPPPAEVKKEEPKKEDPKKEEPKKEEPKKEEPKAEQPPAQPRPMGGGFGGGFDPAYQRTLTEFLQTEGVAATLRDSNKPHGLLVMTGGWPSEGRGGAGGGGGQTNTIPSLFISHEHYAMLYRLGTAKDGPKPKVELEVSNKFIPGPVTVYNTVGEIKGSEKPDEFVVIGAHLDSWDLGSGATDNGTGSCVVLEVARVFGAMAKAGIKPKRTIRFALFTGEEQGLYGSKEYVKKHKDEMPKTSACLVHDTGTGFVKGFGLQGRESVKKVLDPQLETLKTVTGWQGLTLRGISGTDHLSFEARGINVPGFACDQDPDEYYLTHHTQSDTFDHAKEPNLVQGAQCIAVTAMRIANLPDLLPRDRTEPMGGGRGGFGGGRPPMEEVKPPPVEKKEEKPPTDPKKEEKKEEVKKEEKKGDK